MTIVKIATGIPKIIKFKEISSFLLVVLITIVLTRLWTISLFYTFGTDSEIIKRIVNDRWHHYQVGLILLSLGYLLRSMHKSKLISAIGLGIFLEEWPVFLNDLGLNTNGLYHTKLDFILVFGFIGILYVLFSVLSNHQKPLVFSREKPLQH
ncbi:hypothetical protein KKB64_04610 [Patescibacteria group bacterium]|nr:hypothetical protein [Patescibacteria group bacterium]MBU1473032.1 hypothetical protein [Patescibacteria group bacterium]MBU2460212.1 hypothetical protein [Patescibacteria group bacterium]MBU2543901.1 hypothetical protein [Patescibacteria group bacterium]